MKRIKKIFAWFSILSLVLQISGGIFIYQPAFAEEEATPTPEITPSAEPILEPTPTTEPAPSAEPTPSIEPETTAAPTPTEEVTPAPIIEDNQPASENSAPPSETGPPAADNQTPSESPAPTDVIPTENGHLSAVILENVAANSLELDLTTEDIGQSASLVTDKADYAPTDTVFISGSGFNPNEAYTLIISSTDEPPVNFETKITADENGAFVYAYQLDGTYRPNYKVEAKDSSGAVIAVATFTDSPPSPTYIVESYSNNTYATVKNDFLQGETVYGKATRSSAAKMRLRYRNPSNSVVHTCGYSDSTVVYCDYALPFNAPTGGWDIQIGRCDDHCNKSDNWTWTGYGEDHFNVAAIPTVSWPTWTTPSCSIDPANDESPASTDLIGDITYPAVGYANDSNYYYFRERVDSDPAGSGGFDQFAWVVLFQKISPNYQYLASLNGKDEKVQFYQNTTEAGAVDFQPLLNDPAEVLVWEGPASIFARITTDGDGKKAVEWAIPKTVIEGAGISSSTTKFFATSANANNFNKDYLNCYEQPAPVCGDGNLDPGEQCDDGNTTPGDGCSSTCQIEQGTLIIRKIIVGSYPGDPGGPEFYPFYFRMDNGQGGVEVKQIESDGQNDEIVNPGTYTVTEEPYNGFTPSYNNCSNIVVPAGGSTTCTITNTRQTGTITLDKITQPSGDPTQFTLNINYKSIDGSGGDAGLFSSNQVVDADAPVVITVPINWYGVDEINLPVGWTRGNLDCGPGRMSYNFHVNPGENVTCTFTNSRPYCGDGIKNGDEQCDGTDLGGEDPALNFCSASCHLVPIYDGDHVCPQGTVKSASPVATYNISGTDVDGESFNLTSGGKYLFEALGTFIPTGAPGYLSDAGYTWVNDLLSTMYGIHGTPPDYAAHALLANLGNGVGVVDWGNTNLDHLYTKYYEPTTSSVQFLIGDRYGDWFNTPYQNQTGMGDNSGSLTLNVYECQEYGSISGVKWEDLNGNGFRDAGDDALSGWTINLWNGASVIDPSLPADQTTVTAGDGSYSFENLPWGDYTVCEEDRAGWEQTLPGGGTCYYLTVGGNIKPADNIDFGNFKLGMIQGRKYEDLNSDGTRDAGESYLNGWTIRGYKKNGSNWDPIGEKLTGHTGTTGQYNFDGLGLGQYKICEVLQPGWTQTSPTGTTNRVQTDEAPRCRVVTIDHSGRERTGQHFGNIIQSGQITACKYDDYDGDGNNEGDDEPGIAGVTITLEKQGDGWQPVATGDTGRDGCYTFTGLQLGNYRVSEDLNDLPGYNPTSQNPVYTNISTSGQLVPVDFFNELQPITLELDKSNSVSGSTVTFTLTVHNTSLITAHNVKVKDMLPFGFTYKAGTTKINDVSAADPSIFMMLLTWDLGDMTPNQTKVITFETTIGSLPMGIYPNLAFVLGADRDPCDPAFCTLCYSDFAYSLVTIGWGFSTTTHIGGTVLGASTALPQVLGAATGSETYWLVLAFIIILGGVSIMFMTKKRRAWLLKKMAGISKKLSAFSFFLFLISCFFIFAGSAQATNDSLFIRVADLPEYKNTDNFKLYYTALEREEKPISVDCYVEKDGGFGWKTFGGTQIEPSGSCEVFGYELEGDATYRFKAIATSVDGSTESNITQTKIDRSGPEAPKDYRKSRESSTAYKIHWKNPGNDDYGWTRIFASTEQNFTADDATKKADVGGGKDIEFDYVVTGLEPNQDYYFALQGFDKAGNQSGLTGDGGTVTYEVTSAPTQAVAGGVEVVTFPKEEGTGTGGEILGGATEAPTPTEAPVSEGVVAGITSQVGGMNKGWLATGVGILLILAGLGYYFYRRSS